MKQICRNLSYLILALLATNAFAAMSSDSTRIQIRYGNSRSIMYVPLDSLNLIDADSIMAILVDSLATKATITSLNTGLALKLNLAAFDDSLAAHTELMRTAAFDDSLRAHISDSLNHVRPDSITFDPDSTEAVTFADWIAQPSYDGSVQDTITVVADMDKIAGRVVPKLSAYEPDTTAIIQTIDMWSPIVTVPVGYNGLRKISGFVKTTVNKADTNNISLILYEVVAGDTVFCDSLLNVAVANTWTPFSFNNGSSWGIYTLSADSVFPSKTDAGDAANLVDGNTGTTWTLNSGGSAQVVFKTVDGTGVQLDSIRIYTDTGSQTVTVAGTNDSTNVGWDTLATIIQANGAWQGALPQSDSTYQFIRLSWSNALAVVGEVEMYEITSNTDINRDESFILRARMKSMMITRIAELGLLKYHWGN